MKKTLSSALMILLASVCIICLISCNKDVDKPTWENALYTENKELGNGQRTAVVEVKVEEHLVTFTLHTDKDTVGAALIEHGLISGDDSEFGLYIKKVNGITADFDEDQTYWAFYINGEYAMTGVDTTKIDENAVYRLEYTK
jgi:hypothetical protein